ncbi:CAAX amino protease [Actinomadura sp. NBRC 104425]|uniref:CPBP family intramembrane glutamic endopeptidase n=1 Tax=Actinomadura sp. NBRC 104425 TaxID=3032204 RepID=UPI0024A2E9CF|nr:CPBP family intramembrane glutamic endopeptidase [Actinomadura sp. NBRC 104425]GLZ15543.1 CAAX amino protease [Actinomadura sp. NBRC 104425]
MRLLGQLVLPFAAVAAVAFVGSMGAAAVEGNGLFTMVIGVATAVLAVVVYRWVVRRTERRTPEEVAGKGAVPAFGRGLVVGVALFSAVIGNIAFNGAYHVDGLGSPEGAIGFIGFMAAAAATEELMFRGVLFRLIEQRLGTWIAMVLTGALFGAFHLTNPHASLWGAIAIMIEAGGMLAAAYAATRNLWLPIGLHFGWNFAEAGIFSTEVSGNGATEGLLNSDISGPAFYTGGSFGPEASPPAITFCVLATIVFLWLAHRRGNLVPRRRSARAAATATLSQ